MTNEKPPATPPRKKRGRPPKGKTAMTPAERAARYRAKRKLMAIAGFDGRQNIEVVYDAWRDLRFLCEARNAKVTDPELSAAESTLYRAIRNLTESLGLHGRFSVRNRDRKNDLRPKRSREE